MERIIRSLVITAGLILVLISCSPPLSPLFEAVEEEVLATRVRGDIAVVYPDDGSEYSSYGTAFSVPDPELIGATSSTYTFRIENRGTADLSIQSFSLDDEVNYELSGEDPATLSPGEWSEFGLIFHPTESGTISAVIIIRSNDPDEGVFHFNITGEGLTPLPEITVWQSVNEYESGDSGYYFGTLPATVTGDAVEFIIKNEGAADLTVNSLSLTNSADFTLISPPSTPFVVGSSGTRTVNLAFSPDTTGTRNGALEITSDDGDEPTFALNLSGQATVRESITVESTTPVNSAADVRIDGNIEIVFDRDIDPGSTSGMTIKKGTTSYPFTQSWNSSTDTLTLNPNSDLPTQSTITVTLPGTITGYNYELFSQYQFSFTTGTAWHDGNTIFVYISGSASGSGTKADPVKSIQSGVDLAQSKGYTDVYVRSGTYTKTNGGLENSGVNTLLITQPVTIKGGWNSTFTTQGDETTTVLDGLDAADHVIYISLDSATTPMDITLENFTVQGGYADGTYPHSCGGGIIMRGPSDIYADDIDITLRDITIKDSYADSSGGGIYMYSKMNYYLYDTTIADNSADSWGNGVYAGGYGTTYMSYVSVTNNTGTSGGSGMYMLNAGTKTLYHCYFDNNQGAYADNLYISKSNATYLIQYCSFSPRTLPDLNITGTGTTNLTIANNYFHGNSGNTAAAIRESEDISGHTITNNHFLTNYYGSLYQEGNNTPIPDNASGIAILNQAGNTAHDASTASGNYID